MFTVLYDDGDIGKYTIEPEQIEGYEQVKSNAPIISIIRCTNVGDSNNINGYSFKLIEKSDDLNNKHTLITKLKQYDSNGFYHTTSFDNLKSIYKDGFLYSRNILKKRDKSFKDIASKEVLALTNEQFKNSVRFYLKKNAPATYQFKGDLCTLVCDYSVLTEVYNMIITTAKASSFNDDRKQHIMCDINNSRDIDNLINNVDIGIIYADCFNSKYTPNYKDYEIREYNSSELLIENSLPIKHIYKIIFKDEEQKERFKKEFPNWNVNCELLK